MPIKETHTTQLGDDKRPKVGHLAVLTAVAPAAWSVIPPGAAMGAGDGKSTYMSMVLQSVKLQKSGLSMEIVVQCCGNPACTRVMKLGGSWKGKHVDRTGQGANRAAQVAGSSK